LRCTLPLRKDRNEGGHEMTVSSNRRTAGFVDEAERTLWKCGSLRSR